MTHVPLWYVDGVVGCAHVGSWGSWKVIFAVNLKLLQNIKFIAKFSLNRINFLFVKEIISDAGGGTSQALITCLSKRDVASKDINGNSCHFSDK